MNTVTAVESDSSVLVAIIELKWLLAGEGFRLHVERLQTDRDYALQALNRAEASANPALHVAAAGVRARLNL
ncbi:MAG: hypothetical protein Q7S90_07095, partial [Rubrivivax sp.]|nr:hypothetical protein [Rubrivivax sp.]